MMVRTIVTVYTAVLISRSQILAVMVSIDILKQPCVAFNGPVSCSHLLAKFVC